MTTSSPARGAGTWYAKVPALTPIFWVVKVLTTGLGESSSDFLLLGEHWILLALLTAVFVGAFVWQFRTSGYRAIPYWTAVLGVGVFGTVASDIVVYVAGVPLPFATVGYAAATAVVLALWYRSEGTLSVHSITTQRRQKFYWLTVTCTFAMGTAAGDMTDSTLGLGLVGSIVLFGVAIMVPWILYRRGSLHPVVAFWAAYVLTRPLGASVADLLLKPVHDDGYGGGGVGFGAGPVTLGGFVLFAAFVGYLAIKRPDVQEMLEDTDAAPVPPGRQRPDLVVGG